MKIKRIGRLIEYYPLLGFLLGAVLVLPKRAYAAGACDNTGTSAALQNCVKNNKITKDLEIIINVLSVGVGIVVVGMIIVGGIQYMAAGDNPNAVAAAKQRITNALIALVAFLLTFAFLQWLIPGGIFG
jgi:hypothetical protein